MQRVVSSLMPQPKGPYVHLVRSGDAGWAWLSGTVEPIDEAGVAAAVLKALGRLNVLAAESQVKLAMVHCFVDRSVGLKPAIDSLSQVSDVAGLAGTLIASTLGTKAVEVDAEGGMHVKVFGKHAYLPLARAVKSGGVVYLSGQLGIAPDANVLVEGGVASEVHQIFRNFANTLADLGLDVSSIVKTTVYLRDLIDFPALNTAYNDIFGDRPVARSTLGVDSLAFGANVEIEAIAEA